MYVSHDSEYQTEHADRGQYVEIVKATLARKRLLYPGFPVSLISRCSIGTGKKSQNNNTLRLELRLVRAYRRATVTRKSFITAACVSLEIDLPQVLNRVLHLDSEVLQWPKMVYIWGAQNKNNPQPNVCASLADSLQLLTGNYSSRN